MELGKETTTREKKNENKFNEFLGFVLDIGQNIQKTIR